VYDEDVPIVGSEDAVMGESKGLPKGGGDEPVVK
jgi:hypothetical protein